MASSSTKSVAKGKREPEDDLENKQILKKQKEHYDSLFSIENQILKKHKEKSDVEEVALRKKTLFVANLSPQTKISHINNFFNYVGVVTVRLIVNHECKHVGCGFVEFATLNEAKKALEKNGEYLHDHKIFLDVAKGAMAKGATDLPTPKYNLVEKLWYEDYLRRRKKDETVERHVEEVALRKKTLFVANLSPKTNLSHVIIFFKYVGDVVHSRLIVDHEGKHVGYGFVEFASATKAMKALKMNNGEKLHGHEIFLDVAKGASYPLRPKYCIDHKVWYEDYLRQESLLIEKENETFERLVEEVASRKKTLFVANLSPQAKMLDIKRFFKTIG